MKKALSRKNLWEATPQELKDVLAPLIRFVPPEVLLGRRFRRSLAFARAADRWPAERSREYQLRELRRICSLAFDRSPFYRRSFGRVGFAPGDLKGLEDLRRLPTIDARTVREHLREMCVASPRSLRVDYTSTGGTCGEPLSFYIGARRSAADFGYTVASWERPGYRLGMPLAVFGGRQVAADRTGFHHAYDPLLRHHLYSNFHMTDDDMGRYLEHILTIGPCFLLAYPSSAGALARFAARSGRGTPRNILGILAGSENVYAEERAFVERVFGVRYWSSYGHAEKLVLAAECERSTDYHVWPTYGVMELLDEDGSVIREPGRRGEICGTGFINQVMPFIRYRTGDFATYAADSCGECGRQHAIIRQIEGHRHHEVLVAGDQSLISWTAINMHDGTFENVRQFQFFQTSPGQAVLRLVPGSRYSGVDEERILRALGKKLEGRLRFEIELMPEIPLTRHGKTVYVDQRIDVNALPKLSGR